MMRPGTTARLAILMCSLLLAACAGSDGPGAGWTLGPTDRASIASPGASGTPGATVAPSSAVPGFLPTHTPSPSADVRPPLLSPEVQSYGVVTVAFSEPALPAIAFDFVCDWVSAVEVGDFYIAPSTSLAGEQVSFAIQPRTPSYPFMIWRERAASYVPSPSTGDVALSVVGEGWASGSMWFIGLAPNPEFRVAAGPLQTSIEEWLRPIGGDPLLSRLSGTVTWACEPAPPTVPTPGPVASEEPWPTVPPLPRLMLVTPEVRREAVSGCGGSIEIGGYAGADSCGPSFQALGVDYVVRVPEGGRLRFELPTGWHFVGWSLGWVTQVEAERWHGEQPDTFETIQVGAATRGRILELDAPPAGDWSIRLDWRGARGDDRFSRPDYFRVIVGD